MSSIYQKKTGDCRKFEHVAERLRIISNSRGHAACLANIKDFHIWLTSYFINIYPLGMQSSQNIASGMWSTSIHYCFTSHESPMIFSKGIQAWKNVLVFWDGETISIVLCCAVCLWLVNCRWPVTQRAQNGREANCFPLPPDDQALCFLMHLHFFLLQPWIFFISEKPELLDTYIVPITIYWIYLTRRDISDGVWRKKLNSLLK